MARAATSHASQDGSNNPKIIAALATAAHLQVARSHIKPDQKPKSP
jgi:hypothetical protein